MLVNNTYAFLLFEMQKTCSVNLGTFRKGEQEEYHWRFGHTDLRVSYHKKEQNICKTYFFQKSGTPGICLRQALAFRIRCCTAAATKWGWFDIFSPHKLSLLANSGTTSWTSGCGNRLGAEVSAVWAIWDSKPSSKGGVITFTLRSIIICSLSTYRPLYLS